MRFPVIFLVLCGFMTACSEEVPFRKTHFHPERNLPEELYTQESPELTSVEQLNLMQVLLYYGYDATLQDSFVMIPSDLAADLELLGNYTQKMQDSTWLSEHQLE